MIKLTFITLLIILFSCEKKVGLEIPQEEISNEYSVDSSLEKEIKVLGEKISKIEESRVIKNLSKEETIDFSNRLEGLKRNYNETVSLIKESYSKDESDRLRTSLNRTKEVWDYLIKNYKI